jgi:hypothetical protein
MKITTTDGRDPDEVRKEQRADGDKLHQSYIVLSPEERAKGFVREVRRSYRHVGAPGPKHPLRDLTAEEHERYDRFGYMQYEQYPETEEENVLGRFWTQASLDSVGKGCGAVTTMGVSLAETYAREPGFYGSTFCATCGRHYPVGERGEFVWEGSGERVGT